MTTNSKTPEELACPTQEGTVELALQIRRRPQGGLQLRVLKRTATWASEIDERVSNNGPITLSQLSEVLATLSDGAQSELLSRGGVQLSLGSY